VESGLDEDELPSAGAFDGQGMSFCVQLQVVIAQEGQFQFRPAFMTQNGNVKP
jgi:hypothetical protein